jgi:hypothetical protein
MPDSTANKPIEQSTETGVAFSGEFAGRLIAEPDV